MARRGACFIVGSYLAASLIFLSFPFSPKYMVNFLVNSNLASVIETKL